MKKTFIRLFAFAAALAVLMTFFIPFASSAATEYESAYNFNSATDMTWDLSGRNKLINQSYDPLTPTAGYTGIGTANYVGLRSEMFRSNSEMTFALRLKLTPNGDGRIFHTSSAKTTEPYMTLEYLEQKNKVSLTYFDGSVSETLYMDVSDVTGANLEWVHIAFVFRASSEGTLITLCKNGVMADCILSSANLAALSPRLTYLTGYLKDEIYVSNTARTDDEIEFLSTTSVKAFLQSRGVTVIEHVDTERPTDPEHPTGSPDDPSEPYVPVNNGIKFDWIGYTFDDSLDITMDSNRLVSCDINVYAVNKIGTPSYGGKTGYGLTRRTSAYPAKYMTLDRDLLHSAETFTVGMWVYRAADTGDNGTSQMKLLDFTGKDGYLIFAPFADEPYLAAGSSFRYVDKFTGAVCDPYWPFAEQVPDAIWNLSGTSLSKFNNKWVYVALSYSLTGQVSMYINGSLIGAVETGCTLQSLSLTNLNIMTGSSSSDTSRYIIDEIYISSKALPAAEIGKLRSYGIKTYSTQVIPDTGNQGEQGDDPSVVPDESDLLEDKFTSSAHINGFVGTTFDTSSFIGKDINNSVSATVRSPSLSQGIHNYGLTLDGISSYIRYPMQILDDEVQLTVSVAYKWNGPSNGNTQKLFDFSSKSSSVTAPNAYFRLEMGDGLSGLCLRIYDGKNEASIKTNVNTVGSWVRVTATLGNGVARLYVNGSEVGKTNTAVIPSDIKPNYIFVGRSGVKGDALFKGVVDEIYIAPRVLSNEEIQAFETNGIDPSQQATETPTEREDQLDTLWDSLIKGVIVVSVILVLVIAAVIIITVIRK